MPTILFVHGWRFFFYSNEGNEPVHIHCQKVEKECKYWLDLNNFDIIEEYSYNINNADRRTIRKIIFQHFEYIVEEWNNYFQEK